MRLLRSISCGSSTKWVRGYRVSGGKNADIREVRTDSPGISANGALKGGEGGIECGKNSCLLLLKDWT
jgi:hypothetical protein